MINRRFPLLGGALAALGLMFGAAVPAAAQADPAEQMFARLTGAMKPERRAQFCAFVADQIDELAGTPPDMAARARLAGEAQQLRARLAPLLTKRSGDARATARDDGQAMSLLIYAPSSRLRALVESGEADEDDVMWLFVSDVGARCNAMLDKMKVAPAPAMAGPVPMPAFRWNGKDAGQWFAGTPLAPVAVRLCSGTAPPAADLKGLPLTARGEGGISLLDWAMQCRDRAGFAALLEAGHDVNAPGFEQNPPLVAAAGKSDLWYLSALLARGARPDAAGPRKTALATAFARGKPGGGEAFALLRAAGASLNFPEAERAIWDEWSRFGDWDMVLANWAEFKGDPVALGRWVTMDLERPRRHAAALAELQRRLQAEHGVCFPVGATAGFGRDARGFYVQPNCPRAAPSARP